MPFGSLNMPSLGLTQLESVLKAGFGDSLAVRTLYLNLDFARYLKNIGVYAHSLSGTGFMTGIGDWFFRQSAFPETPDNSEEYLARFYFDDSAESCFVRELVKQKRADLDKVLDDMIAAHGLAESDIVGFTALFSQTVASFAMARRLKKMKPDIITIMGGAACEGVMGHEFARSISQIDYFFSGPALVSLPEFVRNRIEGNVAACDRIDGVFSKTNRELWETEVRAPSRYGKKQGVAITGVQLDINANINLDYRPFLDALHSAFPDGSIKPILLFETSRGCSWAERTPCSFCGLNGTQRHYHSLTPVNAVAQIESMFEWSECSFLISVDTIVPRNYFREVFPLLNPPPGMKILYEVRPDLDEEDIQVLTRAGITVIQPGIEALSTQTLKLMRKGTTAHGNIRFLKLCSKYPLSLEWNLLIFSPGEEEKTYEKYLHDIALLTHLPPPTGAYPINYVRHSHYHTNAAQFGLDLQPQDFYRLTYPCDAANIAYHFVDRNSDANHINSWLDRINDRVSFWRTRWSNSDGKLESRLCLIPRDRNWTVYDSRSGTAVEHEISGLSRDLLEFLDQRPAFKSDIAARFAGIPGFDPEKEIGLLKDIGLLFEENGRFLSLVCLSE